APIAQPAPRTTAPLRVQAAALASAPQSGATASGSGPALDPEAAQLAADAARLASDAAQLADGSGPTKVSDGATTPVKLPRGAIAIGPYLAASIPAGRRAPDDMFAPRHHAELGKIVEQVLAAEAPVHVDVLARRVGAYFGVGRVTQRVTDQVRIALAGRGRWGDEQGI